jgi:ketosteroid isomerase-like protein
MALIGAVLLSATTLLGDGDDAAKQILELEKQWSVANVQKDIATLDRIMADDYIGIESVGMVANKAQEIADIRTGGVVVEAEQPTQMKVRLYGNTAVVTGHLSIRDRRDGKPGRHEVVFTDVWIRRGGQWQVVNYQATPLREVAVGSASAP